MTQHFPYLSHHHWLVFDDSIHFPNLSADESLAYQDSFIRLLNQIQTDQAIGILHFYPTHQPTILLGAKDTRLLNMTAGNSFLKQQGYQLSLRSHGGLAVVCNEGVLNIGMASNVTKFPLSIDVAYEQMVHLIRLALAPFNLQVESYEIPHSYCPGTYDLVVNGRKIGGIAQRRFKNGVTTAAYLSIHGDQTERAQLIKEYYRIAQADSSYPDIHAEDMASISEWLDCTITVEDFKQHLLNIFQRYASIEVGNYHHSELNTIFNKMLPIAKDRSRHIQP